MTVTDSSTHTPVETISCEIDGISLNVPKGTLIIRAAEQLGLEIPRFCDHPLLEPVAACRMCLVEIVGQPKPQPACAIPLGEGMVVKTQFTSEVAAKAQRGVMEFLLINHPLDCPVCDKGGECPLQNQAMTAGRGDSRFDGVKRTFPKPINVSNQVLLDRERCVSCARCTRFADDIAGDPLIDLLERGAKQQVGIGEEPFNSYFSGNTIQICPVGALTSAKYRFRARPFDLISTPSVCEHCASGCALRVDTRNSTVMRRWAGADMDVNEEWNCDKGRFAFVYQTEDRITTPLVRDAAGELRPATWPEALEAAGRLLAGAKGRAASLVGGRVTREDAYSWAKFTRVALGSDDIDFRARPTSAEETAFLASHVAGSGLGVTYADLESAPVVLLAGLEPEEESPIVFLRLRKVGSRGKVKVAAIAPWVSPGFAKTNGTVLAAAPGEEPTVLHALSDSGRAAQLSEQAADIADLLRQPGAVVLVGERLSSVAGGLSAAVSLAEATGARLAWVPRRAGERGALDAGALAGVLPGGRPMSDAGARAEVAAAWGVEALPSSAGRDLNDIVATILEDAVAAQGAEDGEPRIAALVVGGVDPHDTADPVSVLSALDSVGAVISLETRHTAVTDLADVVLPVAVDPERPGSYTDWEGRVREFAQVMRSAQTLTDSRVLALLARELDAEIGDGRISALAAELDSLGQYDEDRPAFEAVAAGETPSELASDTALLATWRHLLDDATLQSGEPYLAGTRRPVVARMSAATASAAGIVDSVVVSNPHDESGEGFAELVMPVELTDMPDGVVWLPSLLDSGSLAATLGVGSGDLVRIQGGQG